ncbi:MAG: hypothetical protein AAGJ93_07405 [Bacteroidota bacterium]
MNESVVSIIRSIGDLFEDIYFTIYNLYVRPGGNEITDIDNNGTSDSCEDIGI